MTGHHGAEADPMLDAYDFSGFHDLVDVGGGNGGLLISILKRHEPMRGVLFDLPSVVQRAEATIANAGLRSGAVSSAEVSWSPRRPAPMPIFFATSFTTGATRMLRRFFASAGTR